MQIQMRLSAAPALCHSPWPLSPAWPPPSPLVPDIHFMQSGFQIFMSGKGIWGVGQGVFVFVLIVLLFPLQHQRLTIYTCNAKRIHCQILLSKEPDVFILNNNVQVIMFCFFSGRVSELEEAENHMVEANKRKVNQLNIYIKMILRRASKMLINIRTYDPIHFLR